MPLNLETATAGTLCRQFFFYRGLSCRTLNKNWEFSQSGLWKLLSLMIILNRNLHENNRGFSLYGNFSHISIMPKWNEG